MEVILIWLSLGIIGLSLLMMLGFGLKNAGTVLSQSKLGLAAFALPVVILVILFAVRGDWGEAAVLTAAALTVLGILALLVFGAKSLFTN